MKDEIAEVSHAEGEKDVMAARMKSAMAIDALLPGDRIDNLPPLRAQLSGVLAEFVA
jgi:hypothetical protein